MTSKDNDTAFSRLKLKENWQNLQGRISEAYPALTFDDLHYRAGSEDSFMENIQSKTGRSVSQIIDEVIEL